MTEAKRASEMTMEQIEHVLGDVDWAEVHQMRVFSKDNETVVIYTDGTADVRNSSTLYRDPDAAGVLGYLSCDLDLEVYYGGWCEPMGDGYYMRNDTEEILSEDEMINLALHEGEIAYDQGAEFLRTIREKRSQA